MLVWLVLGLGTAWAQTPPLDPDEEVEDQARRLFQYGQEMYDAARYEDAVAAFSMAYSLSPRPLLLWNMASSLERLGQWSAALDALVAYRSVAPVDELVVLDRRIEGLRVRVQESEAADVVEVLPVPKPTKVKGERSSALPLALFGVGAVGLGSGALFTARAVGARGQWTEQCNADAGVLLCPADAQSLVRRDKFSSVVADVSWLVGVGGVAGGIVVTTRKPRGGGAELAVTGGAGWFMVQGVF